MGICILPTVVFCIILSTFYARDRSGSTRQCKFEVEFGTSGIRVQVIGGRTATGTTVLFDMGRVSLSDKLALQGISY